MTVVAIGLIIGKVLRKWEVIKQLTTLQGNSSTKGGIRYSSFKTLGLTGGEHCVSDKWVPGVSDASSKYKTFGDSGQNSASITN
jgi:hypothetical protein